MKISKTYLLAALALLLVPAVAAAQGVLFVANDNVGIGTSDPQQPLHILRGPQVPFWLQNSSTGTLWAFSNGSGGNFAINLVNSPGNEVTVRNQGDPGGFATLTVNGSVDATNVTFSSARKLKTDFAPVDNREVLHKLVTVPVSEWRYKTHGDDTRQIGPVAEDFHAAFDLGGDSEHISMVASNGINVAAIQGLYEELLDRDEQIARLEERLAELESRLDK